RVAALCLVVFAGGGGWGLEALSCYAAQEMLREVERPVSQQLKKNLATLKANNARVVNTNPRPSLTQRGPPHHVVFVDPPFRK
ncbi:RsmD family RNA methyltransferase, partial [Salmonella enterica]|uniref:RsmD family RNA methyltransferase n=1 Tax=Salmonella enterica TaxID=28901 RepID=UPI000AE868A1